MVTSRTNRPLKVGEVWSSNFHGDFTIESQAFTKNGSRYFNIRFLNTGYRTVKNNAEIKSGEIKDYYNKTVYGVGRLGTSENVDKRVYSVWKAMLGRCYYPKSISYQNYGERGVTVVERWHCYLNFYNDLKLIEGYDESLFYSGKIYLDKDIIQRDMPHSERVYSKETCMFVTASENTLEAIGREVDSRVYVYSEKTGLLLPNDIRKFCKDNSLLIHDVFRAIEGELKGVKGYIFGYTDDIAEKWDAYKRTASKKVIYGSAVYKSVTEASEKIGITKTTVRRIAKERRLHKGKEIRIELLYS